MKNTVSTRTERFATSLVGLCAGIVLIVACAAPMRAAAGELPALLEQKRCNACHTTTATLIGPPFLAVAARYRSDRDLMVEVLARKILLGGGGSWGAVPMVPNPYVTLEEARWMAQWILALQPPS
jgi:cytochrome c